MSGVLLSCFFNPPWEPSASSPSSQLHTGGLECFVAIKTEMPSTTKSFKIIFKSAPMVAFRCPQPTGELHIVPPASALPALPRRNSAVGRGWLSFRLEQRFCKAERLWFSVNRYYFNVCITGEPKSFSQGKGHADLCTSKYVVDNSPCLKARGEGGRKMVGSSSSMHIKSWKICALQHASWLSWDALPCPSVHPESPVLLCFWQQNRSRGAVAAAPAPQPLAG